MTKEEVQQLAFQMISLAGEALDCYYSAIVEFRKGEKKYSEEKFIEGNKKLNECHQIQTNLVFAESNEEEIPYSLIMTHAQDHFSNASNWKQFARILMNYDIK